MSILSANVSLPKAVEYRGRRVEKGIFKDPVAGSVMKRLRSCCIDSLFMREGKRCRQGTFAQL